MLIFGLPLLTLVDFDALVLAKRTLWQVAVYIHSFQTLRASCLRAHCTIKMRRPWKPVSKMKMAWRVAESGTDVILLVVAKPTPQPRPNSRDRVNAIMNCSLNLVFASPFSLHFMMHLFRRREVKMRMKITQFIMYMTAKGAAKPAKKGTPYGRQLQQGMKEKQLSTRASRSTCTPHKH